MPPEEMKERNGMNIGKQDLERAPLQQMLERSCSIINSQKNKVVVGLWRTSQNYEVKILPLMKTMDLDWYKQEDEKLNHREDRRTWDIYKHHKQQQSLGKGFR